MDIINKLRTSGNKLLETEAQDIQVWSKLKHSKKDLELFLTHNLAEIKFLTKDKSETTILCTSNTALIKVFSLVKEKDKKKASVLKSKGIKCNQMGSIMTWDLLANSIKTMSLKQWQIMNFISITKENILLIDKVIHDILKKK